MLPAPARAKPPARPGLRPAGRTARVARAAADAVGFGVHVVPPVQHWLDPLLPDAEWAHITCCIFIAELDLPCCVGRWM